TGRQWKIEVEEGGEQDQIDDQKIFGQKELRSGADRVDDLIALIEDARQQRESVFQEHDVGDFLRNLAAFLHRNAHVRSLDRRKIVDAVADHRRVNLLALEGLDDSELVVGAQAREDQFV